MSGFLRLSKAVVPVVVVVVAVVVPVAVVEVPVVAVAVVPVVLPWSAELDKDNICRRV